MFAKTQFSRSETAVRQSGYFFISSMKPFAMKPMMTRTMIATMTQMASIGTVIPNRVMALYPFFRSSARMRTVVLSTAAHSNAISVFVQARFQSIVDYFKRLDARVALVVALEDDPGGERRARQAEDILDRGFVLGILVAVAPVLVGDLPLIRGV